MLVQLSDRGPDSAGVAVYRDPAPAGATKVSLHSPDAALRLGGGRTPSSAASSARASRRARHATPCWSSTPTPRARRHWLRDSCPELRVMSAGAVDRDLQGGRPADRVRRALRARTTSQGSHGARPHAHGHREPRDDRGLAPVLDRARPVPRAQRLALQPQPRCAASCGARGIEFQTENDSEVAAGYLTWRLREGDSLDAGARGLPRRPRRLLHVRGRHRGRLRRAARPDRLQAGRDGRDRRLGGDGVRVPRDRGAAGRRGRERLGAGAGDASTAGSRQPV